MDKKDQNQLKSFSKKIKLCIREKRKQGQNNMSGSWTNSKDSNA